ncbi:type II secretion system F family protein [Uliginosibacterium sp. 31-16]|uniref:type II secretion system F family protein n=1 Tax=Uliginosibacterium sp. 31-16 TaxID=3068315 RepID=UPI00274020D0|nr:type II secretion system F family protein [Uliginosibacterium sp. 31-16]MDP5241120.1 type II secretion system F family protein [Uliginosibacterium sp. 31-16]
MQYLVKTLDITHAVIEQSIDASDEAAARQQIAARGLTVLSLKKGRMSNGGLRSKFPLLLFSQELLALLKSGLPLVESIDTLAEKESRPIVRATLDGLSGGMRQGKPLSAMLEAQPGAFPTLYVAMLRAAERTSDLDQALERYIAYRQQMDALRGKIISASIYPLLLLSVGGLVVVFLLGFVVPRFAGVFEEVGGDLPFASKLLIDWGNLIQQHSLPMLLAVACVATLLTMAVRSTTLRAAVGRSLWKIPAIGTELKVFQLARFYRTLAMLLRGGIPVLTALQMTRELLSATLHRGLDTAMLMVREGRSLTDALSLHGLTTPVANRMLRVGEKAGNLGEMAERIAVFHEEEIGRRVELLTRLIGPALMLLIGTVIGLIVVLMYLPIFQLAESIQ